MRTDDETISVNRQYEDFKLHAYYTSEEQVRYTNEDLHCRYCWDNDATPENPLLRVCSCRGSASVVHYVCLKAFQNSKQKIVTDTNSVTTILWKYFECELCKKGLPFSLTVEGKLLSLVDF